MKRILMWDEQVVEMAERFVGTNSTIRKVAKEFGVSKSTVHLRLTEFINSPNIYYKERELIKAVIKLIAKNKQERHIRGGNATKKKFQIKEKYKNEITSKSQN